jgi:hypothetical protein
VLLLKILGGVAALGLGIYLGLAGHYRPDPAEIERALTGEGRTRRARRHFTPLGWLRKNEERSSHVRRRRAPTGMFNLYSPESKPESKKESKKD